MSTFLGWSSALIPAGATSITMQSTFASVLTAYTWQVVRQAVIPTSIGGTATTPANAMDLSSTTSASQATLPMSVNANITTGFLPVYMYVQTDGVASLNEAPLTFTLDYSTNGSSWTTLQTFSSQTNWSYGERRKYTITGATSQTWWRINVTAVQSATTCAIAEWTLEDTNGNWLTNANFIDCIPPTTETIGNSYSRDVLRWQFPAAGTSITFRPIQELLTTMPQINVVYGATAGAVTSSLTINANTVSFIGTAGNTAIQNARGLYEALKASVNANFTAWNWVWDTTVQGTAATVGGPGSFYAVNKTATTYIAITSTNITTQQRSCPAYSVPITQGSQFVVPSTLTIDILNGWIYFLQITSRGLAIASKTNSAYYGPIHMCYGDNASAIAQIPTADLAAYGIPCTPIELLVGTDNVVADTDGVAYPSHSWGVSGAYYSCTGMMYIDNNSSACNIVSNFIHHGISGQLQDYASYPGITSGVGGPTYEISGEGIFQGADSGNQFSIHKLSCTPGFGYPYNGGAEEFYFRCTAPAFSGLDWYKFTGTAPSNEQLVMGPSNDFTTTVSTTGLMTDTTINVASTTGFPTTNGWLMMDGEFITYTGVTSNSFTGCTRGMYNSVPVSPVAGTTVYIGAWYVFIIQGLLFAGYILPT